MTEPEEATTPAVDPAPAAQPVPVPAGFPLEQHLEELYQDLRRNLGPRIETEAMNILTEVVEGFKARIAALIKEA